MTNPDDVFARAHNQLVAKQAAARVVPLQRDHRAADQLLRRFAERMRGTERTKIVLGDVPRKPVQRRKGLFGTETIYPASGPAPSVMGWAFLTGPDGHPWFRTVRHGDPDSRTPTYETYEVFAVDAGGQLYLASVGQEPPRIMGLLDVPEVQGFERTVFDGPRVNTWDGNGRRVLAHVGYYSPSAPPYGSSDRAWRDYENRVAKYDQECAAADEFLAPGLAAALAQVGR